jgi:hypothetical protein
MAACVGRLLVIYKLDCGSQYRGPSNRDVDSSRGICLQLKFYVRPLIAASAIRVEACPDLNSRAFR